MSTARRENASTWRPVAASDRSGRLGALLVALWATGCVFPATEPTGLEISWRFVESNEVDGEDAIAVRSCAGAITEQVAVEITDVDDPSRSSIFRFDCLDGYQTAIDVQTEASDAFVRLNAGTYALTVDAIDDADNAQIFEQVDSREVEVQDRGISIATWELRRATVALGLTLSGGDACEQMQLSLRYAAPEADLAEYAPPGDGSLPPLYRTGLISDRDLQAGGEPFGCSADLDGPHVFEGLDRGEYVLEIDVDGLVCALVVDLRGQQGASSVIDLANLPCDG